MDKLLELNKIRLDLAWKYFEHYAKQRTTMFNFHILFIGGLFYAIVTISKNGAYAEKVLHIGIGFLGFAVCIIFWALDLRNQYLYRLAEYNIFLIERNFLYSFDDEFKRIRIIDRDSYKEQMTDTASPKPDAGLLNDWYQGIVSEEFLERKSNLQRLKQYKHNCIHQMLTYRVLMPIFYFVTALVFFGIIFHAGIWE